MAAGAFAPGSKVVIDLEGLGAIITALDVQGWEVWGPTVSDAPSSSAGSRRSTQGIGDEQAPGHYRPRRRDDGALFGFAASPHSAKRELLPPRVPLYRIRKNGQDLEVQPPPTPERKLALLGTRACELAAIGITDKVLSAAYARTPKAFLSCCWPTSSTRGGPRWPRAVLGCANCTLSCPTCFCTST
jgi:hypothetical protein